MLQSIGRDYLVEVFRPRNCYEQDWADIDTFQFRLESQDLLIGRVIDQENGCEEWGGYALDLRAFIKDQMKDLLVSAFAGLQTTSWSKLQVFLVMSIV